MNAYQLQNRSNPTFSSHRLHPFASYSTASRTANMKTRNQVKRQLDEKELSLAVDEDQTQEEIKEAGGENSNSKEDEDENGTQQQKQKRSEDAKQSVSEHVDENKGNTTTKDENDPKDKIRSRDNKKNENESLTKNDSPKETECKKISTGENKDESKNENGTESNDEKENKEKNDDENSCEVDGKNESNRNIDNRNDNENDSKNDNDHVNDYHSDNNGSHNDNETENVDINYYDNDVDMVDINVCDLDIDIELENVNNGDKENNTGTPEKKTDMEIEKEHHEKGAEDFIIDKEENQNYSVSETPSKPNPISIEDEGDETQMEFSFYPVKDDEVLPKLDFSLSEAVIEAPPIYEGDGDDDYAIGGPLSFLCDSSASNNSAVSPVSNGGEIVFTIPDTSFSDTPPLTDHSPSGKIDFDDAALMDDGEEKEDDEDDIIFSFSSNDKLPFRKIPPFKERWDIRYKELLEFHSQTGHANVPHTYPQNQQLARWVKRQRRQYKLRGEGKKSAITIDRLNLLESIGFVWDSHELSWKDKFDKLKEYQVKFGNCNVASTVKKFKLGTWVKCQRRQYKLYKEGKPSAMFPERIAELEAIGFEWKLRSRKKENSSVALEAKNNKEKKDNGPSDAKTTNNKRKAPPKSQSSRNNNRNKSSNACSDTKKQQPACDQEIASSKKEDGGSDQ